MTENQIEHSIRRTLVDNGMLGRVAYTIQKTPPNLSIDGYIVILRYLVNGVWEGVHNKAVFSYMDTEGLEKRISELISDLKEEGENG